MNKLLLIVVVLSVVFSVATASNVEKNIKISENVKAFANGTAQCDICEVVVSAAEFLIKNGNYTQPQVEAELKKICTIVPANLTKECDFFMFFSAPVITAALFNGENPDQLCTKYKICTSSSTELNVEDQQKQTIESTSDKSMNIESTSDKSINIAQNTHNNEGLLKRLERPHLKKVNVNF